MRETKEVSDWEDYAVWLIVCGCHYGVVKLVPFFSFLRLFLKYIGEISNVSFTKNIHYGGRLVRDCVFHYKWGYQHGVYDINLDKWNFFNATGISKEISDLDQSKYRL